MDVQMPGMNGFETVEVIKRNRHCARIPVIFLTAISKESRYIARGYSVGAIDYLTKPVDPAILQAKVAAFVELYRTQEQLREEIAQRKRAEHRLLLASRAIENTVEGVIITDAEGTILSVNHAFQRVTGYSREEAIGNNPRMLQSGRQDAAFYRAMWRQLTEEGSWSGRVWNRRKNGEIYAEHLSITAIRNKAGEVTNYVGVFSDISRELSMEEQMVQAQKMQAIGTLVGGIAHDFNNLLGGITGNIYLAEQKIDADSPAREHLRQIDKLCRSSARMIAQLLAFARKGMVTMQEVPLRPFLKEVFRLARLSIPENIHFTHHLPPAGERLTVRGDATQLQQVMLNLINNARDAVAGTPEPEIAITVSTTSDDPRLERLQLREGERYAHITVVDNGCGIPQENLPHIFEPFFTTKEVGKGSGLGLAMCYGTIESHHGILDVESTVGRGTSFHLLLPLLDDAQSTGATEQPMEAAPAADGAGITILLADDAENVRTPCAEFLRDLGYSVLEAEDGKEALALFTQHQQEVALALLDVVMPFIGGPQLARRLREIKPDLPVIFVTGYDRSEVFGSQEAMERSAVLTKPCRYPALAAEIARMLRSG
ncbi:MAG: response regulator [Zetaproteobacteria bacterium]|nr:MAG: response regulator [Zetaproteobacteria bacterium]